MKNLLFAAMMAGCATSTSTPLPDSSPAPAVYHCSNGVGGELEVCWTGTAGSLEDALGPYGPPDWYCGLVSGASCTYDCDAGAACGTRNGCWCKGR